MEKSTKFPPHAPFRLPSRWQNLPVLKLIVPVNSATDVSFKLLSCDIDLRK